MRESTDPGRVVDRADIPRESREGASVCLHWLRTQRLTLSGRLNQKTQIAQNAPDDFNCLGLCGLTGVWCTCDCGTRKSHDNKNNLEHFLEGPQIPL